MKRGGRDKPMSTNSRFFQATGTFREVKLFPHGFCLVCLVSTSPLCTVARILGLGDHLVLLEEDRCLILRVPSTKNATQKLRP